MRTGRALAAAGLIDRAGVGPADAVGRRYAVAVTPHVAGLIEPGAADDPVARQYLPDPRELARGPGERDDPIGDDAHSPLPGLVHRYPDRVLLMPTMACPVYCRFCFRRERVGPGARALPAAALDDALAYIAARPAIREVILTGGDPLILSPRRLGGILRRIAGLGAVEAMRIHSRVPVADPGRIDAALVAALRHDVPVYVSIHCNHPRELDKAAARAIAALADAGLPLLGQTVLLRGVNDDADTLAALFRALVRHRVRPYYLHHPDPAPGTARFRLTVAEGQALMRALRGRLSGLCQPSYVIDIPGGHGKVPVGPAFRDPDGGLRDWRGNPHPDPDGAPFASPTASC